ncbi:hypothetical protein EV127DRAFT_447739 [Xylaria flabelliformis]|nr:hypothetical protein EV127DRAFT_447739 [Xylaria flabelliformis]
MRKTSHTKQRSYSRINGRSWLGCLFAFPFFYLSQASFIQSCSQGQITIMMMATMMRLRPHNLRRAKSTAQ